MAKIGITGHQRIPAEALAHVTQGIRAILAAQASPIVGLTSLAAGADQLFARLVIEAGGTLAAVIPSKRYEETFASGDLVEYQSLLAQATTTTVLDFAEPTEDAFMAAGEDVVANSDLLVAVWDGQPAAGLGGTADAVWYAWSQGIPVVNVWPKGVRR